MNVENIFHAAKERFGWADDSSTFGKNEYWATYDELIQKAVSGKVRGDCDDFAELCVHELRATGFRARFVLCLTETDEAHLVAETEGLILDNRQVYVTPQEYLKYNWLAISGYSPGEPWHLIKEG